MLCLAAEEVATDSDDKDASVATADSADSSISGTQVEESLLCPLAEHIEQHELMTAAQTQAGRNFVISLTMLTAGDLAKEVAAIFQEVYTHPSKQLYDDTAHLLYSNY